MLGRFAGFIRCRSPPMNWRWSSIFVIWLLFLISPSHSSAMWGSRRIFFPCKRRFIAGDLATPTLYFRREDLLERGFWPSHDLYLILPFIYFFISDTDIIIILLMAQWWFAIQRWTTVNLCHSYSEASISKTFSCPFSTYLFDGIRKEFNELSYIFWFLWEKYLL